MTIFANGALLINFVLIVMIVIALIVGYTNGLLWQIIRIIALVAVVVLSFVLAPGLADLINIVPKSWVPFANTALADVFYSKINTLVWYIIVILCGYLIMFIVKPIFKAITEIKIIKPVDKTLGMIFSLIPVAIISVVMTYLLSSAMFTNGNEIVDQTILKYVRMVSSDLSSVVDETFKENTAIQKLISNPLALDENDIAMIIDWLKNAQVDSETIKSFLEQYGISTEGLN